MYLVIDIGGTFAKYACMNSAGHIITKNKKRTPRTNLSDFKHLLFSIIEEQEVQKLKGIAISCPGTVDVETGTIYFGGSLPFLHEVNLTKIIHDKYGVKATIENDAKCAALAELWLGSVKGKKDSVVLVLGSGVGGGIIINGKLHRGINLSAGEVSFVMDKINLTTSKASFFGYHCSAVEMIRQIADLKQLKDQTDGEAVFDLINKHDIEASAIFDQYCLHLAVQILNLQYILDPELFAIGGGISAQPVLIERIQWALEEIKKKNPIHNANPQIVVCKFQNDANLYGALYHFFIRTNTIPVLPSNY